MRKWYLIPLIQCVTCWRFLPVFPVANAIKRSNDKLVLGLKELPVVNTIRRSLMLLTSLLRTSVGLSQLLNMLSRVLSCGRDMGIIIGSTVGLIMGLAKI